MVSSPPYSALLNSCVAEACLSVLQLSKKINKSASEVNMMLEISLHLYFLSVSSPTSAIMVNKRERESVGIGPSAF